MCPLESVLCPVLRGAYLPAPPEESVSCRRVLFIKASLYFPWLRRVSRIKANWVMSAFHQIPAICGWLEVGSGIPLSQLAKASWGILDPFGPQNPWLEGFRLELNASSQF